MKTVVINSQNVVVDVIVGDLSIVDQEAFGNHYISMYGNIEFINVNKDESVWIGGTYDNGTFSQPKVEDIVLVDEQVSTE